MECINISSNIVNNCVMEVLSARENLQGLTARSVSHSSYYNVLHHKTFPNRFLVVYSPTFHKNAENVKIEISDLTLISGIKNVNIRKLFILILAKINDSALSDNGHIFAEKIGFRLSELVDIGMYRSVQSARKGFLFGIQALTALQLSLNNENLTFIRDGSIENGICTVRLYRGVRFLKTAFMSLPMCYFALNSRESDLFYYICYLARQNSRKIGESGCFSISFMAILEKLWMPTATKYGNRWVRKPIAAIVETMNTVADGYFHISLPQDYFTVDLYRLQKEKVLIHWNGKIFSKDSP